MCFIGLVVGYPPRTRFCAANKFVLAYGRFLQVDGQVISQFSPLHMHHKIVDFSFAVETIGDLMPNVTSLNEKLSVKMPDLRSARQKLNVSISALRQKIDVARATANRIKVSLLVGVFGEESSHLINKYSNCLACSAHYQPPLWGG